MNLLSANNVTLAKIFLAGKRESVISDMSLIGYLG